MALGVWLKNPCLTCMGPWVPSPEPKPKVKMYHPCGRWEKMEGGRGAREAQGRGDQELTRAEGPAPSHSKVNSCLVA